MCCFLLIENKTYCFPLRWKHSFTSKIVFMAFFSFCVSTSFFPGNTLCCLKQCQKRPRALQVLVGLCLPCPCLNLFNLCMSTQQKDFLRLFLSTQVSIIKQVCTQTSTDTQIRMLLAYTLHINCMFSFREMQFINTILRIITSQQKACFVTKHQLGIQSINIDIC